MPPADDPNEDRPEASSGTLGDLLYADKATPVPEKDWVALVESIAGGDERALHDLYQRTHRIVYTLMARITNNRETAEELTLDVFHDVWRRAASYDAANGTVIGWIMNQARSRAIDRMRFDQRKKRVDPHPESPAAAVAESTAHDALEAGEQTRILVTALKTLTPDERDAIETTFFSELTHAEAASRLKQPLGTIKTRIRSGLRKLRQVLGGY